jgi:hypothetical protein
MKNRNKIRIERTIKKIKNIEKKKRTRNNIKARLKKELYDVED